MIFNIQLKNEQIDLKKVHLDISKYGVYLLQGENGCGKSTLMKQLIFEENQTEGNNAEQKQAYDEKRHGLISYVEQDPIPYKTSVREYVYKSNSVFDEERFVYLIKSFDMEHIELEGNVEKLSGGEIVKLNIIAALLKDTPYIFMDEPTNNLDNPSVRAFIKVIEGLAKEHTFLIVSHDPRLEFKQSTILKIENGKLHTIQAHEEEKNIKDAKEIKYPKKRLVQDYMRSLYSVSSVVCVSILLVMVLFINWIIYMTFMNTENISDVSDVIVTYKTDMQYEELNQNYAKYEKLEIKEEQQYKMIYFDDLDEILMRDEVKKIILPDTAYIDRITELLEEAMAEEKMPKELPILSVPYDVLMNYSGQLLLPCDVKMLLEGRLPLDNMDEVVISENLLAVFGIEKEQAIGKRITINNREYDIVGIGYFDLCLISFEDENDYGYFVYDSETSKEKIGKLKKYFEEQEYYISNGVFNTIIYVKENCEKELLNELLVTYPAENYVSREFELSYKKYVNRTGALILYIMNLVMAILGSGMILSISRKAVRYQVGKAQSFDVYFCLKNKTKKLFSHISYIYYVIGNLLMIVVTIVLTRYLLPYIMLNGIISVLVYTIGMRKE